MLVVCTLIAETDYVWSLWEAQPVSAGTWHFGKIVLPWLLVPLAIWLLASGTIAVAYFLLRAWRFTFAKLAIAHFLSYAISICVVFACVVLERPNPEYFVYAITVSAIVHLLMLIRTFFGDFT